MSAFHMEGGKQYQQLVGSRRQVFNGTAKKTGYGKAALTKKHLKMNKHGRIVSVKKSRASRKNKNLGKFLQKRGSKTFGPVLAKKKGGEEMKRLEPEEFAQLNAPMSYDAYKAIPFGWETYNNQYAELVKKKEEGKTVDEANKEIKQEQAKELEAQQAELEQKKAKEAEERMNAEREFHDGVKKAVAEAAPVDAPPAEGGKKKAKKSKK